MYVYVMYIRTVIVIIVSCKCHLYHFRSICGLVTWYFQATPRRTRRGAVDSEVSPCITKLCCTKKSDPHCHLTKADGRAAVLTPGADGSARSPGSLVGVSAHWAYVPPAFWTNLTEPELLGREQHVMIKWLLCMNCVCVCMCWLNILAQCSRIECV